MGSIRPTTYNEIVRYKSCLAMKGYINGMDDALMERVYHFLGENPNHTVNVQDGKLFFFNGSLITEAVNVQTPPEDSPDYFTSILLTATAIKVSKPVVYSGGDFGSSGNNNNNNNNNNNG